MPPKRAATTKAAAKDAPAAAKNKANTAAKVTKPATKSKAAETAKAPAKGRGRPKKEVVAEPEAEADSGSEADSEEAEEETKTTKTTKTKVNGKEYPIILIAKMFSSSLKRHCCVRQQDRIDGCPQKKKTPPDGLL